MSVEDKANELREHLRGLVNMGFANFDSELDLLDYLLGDKCAYVYDTRTMKEDM